jgi:DNA-binding winged helix-turn-helix (wHTH) protein
MAFDVLVVLARNAGRLVHKRELLASVWPDTCVEPGILTVYISQLRSALDDTASPRKYIETVVRFGYRFVAPVVRHPSSRIAGPIHSKALEHVERGRLHLLNGSHFALEHAVDSFRAAVRANASDARAYAGLALARCTQAQHLADAPRRAYADATHAALRAFALDPSDATVQVALATLLFFMEWDWASAERAVQRALEINAEHVDAYLLYGNLLETRAHLDDGLAMKVRALEHAPASPHVLTDIAVSFWRRRDYMNTIAWSERALAHDSVHVRARMYLAFALWKLGRYDAVTNELLRQADAFGYRARDADSRRGRVVPNGRISPLAEPARASRDGAAADCSGRTVSGQRRDCQRRARTDRYGFPATGHGHSPNARHAPSRLMSTLNGTACAETRASTTYSSTSAFRKTSSSQSGRKCSSRKDPDRPIAAHGHDMRCVRDLPER